MATFIIFAHGNGHGLLQTFADIFHSPSDLSDEMIFINTYFCIREKSMGKINVGLPHITDEILYSKPLRVVYFPKIGSKVRLRTIGKYIHNGMILWVYKNTLIFTCASISFKFVDRNSLF